MKETEHECFQRLITALKAAEAAALKMHDFRPDQSWLQVAATLNVAADGVQQLVGTGFVRSVIHKQ